MFQNRTVICGGIAVFECLVYISLGISIAFFHKENPSIGIQISTVVRLRLDGFVAHRLSLMQVKKQGISFYSLQALFWNQLLLPGERTVKESDLKKFDATLDVAGDNVPVSFKNGNMTYSWTANRTTGRITAADVVYKSAQNGTSNLHVDYGNFKSVGVKMFPATLNLTMTTTATRKKQEAKISLELNQVKTDSKWSTQTEISSKYKQISPTDVLSKILSM